MEIVLGLIVLLAVAIYYGFFASAETLARMGNRKVERMEAEQIKEDIEYYNANAIDNDAFAKAVAQKKALEAYRTL